MPKQVNRIPGIKGLASGKYQARVFHDGFEESRNFSRLEDAQRWQRNLKQDFDRCPEGITRLKRTWHATLLTSSGVITKSFADLDESIEWLNRGRVQVSMGTWLDSETEKLTFSGFVDIWLKTKRDLGGKTEATYRSQLRLHIYPTFGNQLLSSITTVKVKQWVAQLSENEVGPTTIRQSYRLVRQILQSAVDEDSLLKNPCNTSIILPKIIKQKKKGLTREQVESLAAECGSYSILVRFLAATGMRIGEALALRVEDFDFQAHTVHIDKSWTTDAAGRRVLGNTKTKTSRTIPLSAPVLRDLRIHLEDRRAEGWVFTGAQGGCLEYGWFRRRIFKPATIRSGLKDVKIHSLRHTCASLLISLNAPITTVSYILGHSSVKMTLDTYGHYYEDDTATWMANLGKFLDSAG